MKKIFSVLLAVALAVGMAGMAQAGQQVYIQAPDNPGIPAGSCQGISSIILGLSGNVNLRAGDTGQFNLPVGITVCKDIDFFIGNSTNGRLVAGMSPTGGPAADGRYGPIEVFKTVTSASANGVYARVQAAVGSQSVVLSILGDTTADFVEMHGGDKELAMRIRLFDRAIWTVSGATNVKFAFNANSNWFYNGPGGWNVLGNGPLSTTNQTDKSDRNAICIQTPANWVNLITAAFESQDSLNPGVPKWDYTNDPNFESGDNVIFVANILAATAFECLPICKQEDWDYVAISGISQGGTGVCSFNYNVAFNTGYCMTVGGPLNVAWTGQYLAIKKTSNFSAGDYELQITLTGTGTWFNGATTTNVAGFLLGTDNATVCSTTGTAVVDSRFWYTMSGPVTAPVASTSCSVPTAQRIVRHVIDLSAINPYAILKVWIPGFQYNIADVSAGDEVEVTLDLIKKPCGTIFTCTEKVAEYVDTCPTVVVGACDPFMLPYFPPINDAVWWSGAALSNCSSGGATCTLNFYESDGDWGTWDLTLGPWGQWSGLWTSVAAGITPDAGNAGTLGDATFFVCICCSPNAGGAAGSPVGALGMMGTGDQSHGYDVNSW